LVTEMYARLEHIAHRNFCHYKYSLVMGLGLHTSHKTDRNSMSCSTPDYVSMYVCCLVNCSFNLRFAFLAESDLPNRGALYTIDTLETQ
jgi:hypothetical protein